MAGSAAEPWLRPNARIDRAVAERVEARLAERIARGVILPDEVERVGGATLRILSSATESEAFRNCCVNWELDGDESITSHRRFVGPILVAVKTVVRRALRFQYEGFVAQQRAFNWNLLLVVRELLERREP